MKKDLYLVGLKVHMKAGWMDIQLVVKMAVHLADWLEI
jgi:hypothetical protein